MSAQAFCIIKILESEVWVKYIVLKCLFNNFLEGSYEKLDASFQKCELSSKETMTLTLMNKAEARLGGRR